MKKKVLVTVSLLLMLTLIMGGLSGCVPAVKNTQNKTSEITVVDLNGEEITLDSIPNRIVSLSPSNTEILFAIGAGSKVVGITSYCNYPIETSKIEKVGDFNGPNLELIKKANPEVVLIGGMIQEELANALKNDGIKVINTEATDFASIYKSIQLIGDITGKGTDAKSIIEGMESRIASIKSKTKNLKKVNVFYVVWTDPLMTAGSGTFIDEVIKAAGGKNVASKAIGWAQYSVEQLIKDNPTMLVAASHSTNEGMKKNDFEKSEIFSKLNAVKKGKIYVVKNDDIMSRPGPRIVDAIKELAKEFHGIK